MVSGGSIREIASGSIERRVLKVGARSEAKTVAGSIAHVTRAAGPPALLAMGSGPVNQAAKAVAIASRYLEQEARHLVCLPRWRDAMRSRAVFELVTTDEPLQPREGGAAASITTAGGSNPSVVAGAVAGKLREGCCVTIKAIGADSVANAVYAIATAHDYVRDDGMELGCLPHFIKENVGPDVLSVMAFTVVSVVGLRRDATTSSCRADDLRAFDVTSGDNDMRPRQAGGGGHRGIGTAGRSHHRRGPQGRQQQVRMQRQPQTPPLPQQLTMPPQQATMAAAVAVPPKKDDGTGGGIVGVGMSANDHVGFPGVAPQGVMSMDPAAAAAAAAMHAHPLAGEPLPRYDVNYADAYGFVAAPPGAEMHYQFSRADPLAAQDYERRMAAAAHMQQQQQQHY